jgi:hypothetical protein
MYYQSPIQIQQNPAKSGQAGPKKIKEKARISLNPLCRIEPFQSVALTPQGKKIFCLAFPSPSA